MAHLTAERIRLLFEPMVAVTQTAIARYEVSPRLAMADGELLTASRIGPMALRSGLLESLDAWILTAGLDALKVSCDAGRPVQLFLHQSFSSMRRADWVERIRDQINARDLFRRRPVLQLQIQELSEDLELASARIQSLAHLGIRVCLNGLDTHPAALDALDTLPGAFTRLARDLAQAPDPAPLSELIQRAKARGLKVIATGVDGPETIARLCRAGADLLQGPFVQPPSPVMDYDFSGLGGLDAG
jgi:EAL domain-containing protein (putative c-di-GMP-specific phosphodiesterase class I)